jgi:CubicO group peptidase (beta-lactamase class C family)
MMMYLNHGTLNEAQVLSPESVSTLTETSPIDGRGLGWYIGESNGERYLEHMGGGAGFASTMRLYPEAGIGIAILANGTDLDRKGLADLVKGLDWSATHGKDYCDEQNLDIAKTHHGRIFNPDLHTCRVDLHCQLVCQVTARR